MTNQSYLERKIRQTQDKIRFLQIKLIQLQAELQISKVKRNGATMKSNHKLKDRTLKEIDLYSGDNK